MHFTASQIEQHVVETLTMTGKPVETGSFQEKLAESAWMIQATQEISVETGDSVLCYSIGGILKPLNQQDSITVWCWIQIMLTSHYTLECMEMQEVRVYSHAPIIINYNNVVGDISRDPNASSRCSLLLPLKAYFDLHLHWRTSHYCHLEERWWPHTFKQLYLYTESSCSEHQHCHLP